MIQSDKIFLEKHIKLKLKESWEKGDYYSLSHYLYSLIDKLCFNWNEK